MSRKVEIASIFELHDAALDEVRKLGNGEFVSFNHQRQLFSLECNDDEAPNAVASTLRSLHEDDTKPDLTDEPKLRRLPGMTLTNPIQLLRARYSAQNRKGSELLTYTHSDSESESESEVELPSSSSHSSFKWKPTTGVLPDKAFIEAVALLKAPIRKNMFILERRQESHRFDTPPLRENLQLASRVIAPDNVAPEGLLTKHVSQLRIVTLEGITTPSNLTKQERLNKDFKGPEQSILWTTHKYTQYGDQKPNVGLVRDIYGLDVSDDVSLEQVEILKEPTTSLSRDQTQFISKWAGEIGPATPEDVVERPMDRDGVKAGKRRQVRESDDESSVGPKRASRESLPLPTRPRFQATGKIGKQRVVKDSEDESEGSSQPDKQQSGDVVSGEQNWDLDYFEQGHKKESSQAPIRAPSRKKSDTLIDVEGIEASHSKEVESSDDPESLPSSISGTKQDRSLSDPKPQKQAELSAYLAFTNGFDPSKYAGNRESSGESLRNLDTLFVGSLGTNTTISQIAEAFSKYGTLTKVNYKHGKGYAYITFNSPNEAQAAAKGMDGGTIAGRKTRVKPYDSQYTYSPPKKTHQGPHNIPPSRIYRECQNQRRTSSDSVSEERGNDTGFQSGFGKVTAGVRNVPSQTRAPKQPYSMRREPTLINTADSSAPTQALAEQAFCDYSKEGLLPVPAETMLDSMPAELRSQSQSEASSYETAPLPLAPVTTSKTSQSPSPPTARGSDLYTATHPPVINLAHLNREKLRSLEARIAKNAALKEAAQNASSTQAATSSSQASEHLQVSDEVSSRRFFNTMAQKAGKGKQRQAKAATDRKRQDVLTESWGQPVLRKASPPVPTSQEDVQRNPEGLTTTTLTKFQNPLVQYLPISVHNMSVAARLSRELLPILEPLQAFTGQLTFKMELGQVLISGSSTNAIGNNYPRDLKDWDTIFSPSHGKSAPGTIFASNLTTNGKDIDHLLRLKHHNPTSVHGGPQASTSEIFDPDPEQQLTTYEFHCQSKDNESFIVALTETGELRVQKPPRPLGFVNLHYIGQIWDARAVVSGNESLEISPELESAIIDLQNSVYIPPGRTQLELTYRRPIGSEIRIEKICCVRTTLHRCLRSQAIMMEAVLVQDLLLQNRADDTTIYRAFSKPYAAMVESDRLRWKASFVAPHLKEVFRENESLTLGTLVDGWTASALLYEAVDGKQTASTTIRDLVALTDAVVKQIDGVGYHNFGALRRFAESHGGVSGLGSMVYNNVSSDDIVSPEGAQAHEKGWVKKGSGHEIEVKDAVMPDDSASQAGAENRQGGEGWRTTHQLGCGRKVKISDKDFWLPLRRAAFRLLASPSTGYLIKPRHISTVTPSFLRTPRRCSPANFQRRWASSEAEAKEDAPISEVEPTPTEEIENAVQEDNVGAQETQSAGQAAAASEGATSTTEPEDRTAESTENWHSTDPATTSSEQDPARNAPELSHEDKSVVEEVTETVKEKAQDAASTLSNATSTIASRARESPSTRSQPQDDASSFEAKPTIYVGNLFFDVTENDLVKAFGPFGQITRSRLVRDARGLSKGFGYIDFESTEAAHNAILEMNQKLFEGRRLRVQYAAFTSKTVDDRLQTVENRPKNPPSKTLFIGNMSFEMTDRDLNQLFRSVKNVIDVRVAIDRRTGQPRGFAHADFIDVQSAVDGLEALKQKEVYGRKLRVDFSVTPEQQRPRA